MADGSIQDYVSLWLEAQAYSMHEALLRLWRLTLSSILSMPMAFQISTKYFPVILIFSKSPDILLFICAKTSATLQCSHHLPLYCHTTFNCRTIHDSAQHDDLLLTPDNVTQFSHVSPADRLVHGCRGLPELEGHTTFCKLIYI